MRVTKKKLEANRRNALRSSGPKTEQGKSIARWNALQHGLLSREVLVPGAEGKEGQAEFAGLLARLRRNLRLHGELEKMLVEKIAVCHWRLGRVLRCETGEIRRGLEYRLWERNRARDFGWVPTAATAGSATAQHDLRNTSGGLEFLETLVEMSGDELRLQDQLSSRTLEALRTHFHNPKWLSQEVLDEPNGRQNLREALQVEAGYLRKERREVERKEAREQAAQRASLSIPGKEGLERIVRYEASIERNLLRALRQLERLQSRRRRSR